MFENRRQSPRRSPHISSSPVYVAYPVPHHHERQSPGKAMRITKSRPDHKVAGFVDVTPFASLMDGGESFGKRPPWIGIVVEHLPVRSGSVSGPVKLRSDDHPSGLV